MSVQKQKKCLIDNTVAASIDFIDRISCQADSQSSCEPCLPIFVSHLMAVGAKPHQVFDVRPPELAPLEEIAPTEHRMLMKKTNDKLAELQKFSFRLIEMPIEPRNLVVLTVCIVIAVL